MVDRPQSGPRVNRNRDLNLVVGKEKASRRKVDSPRNRIHFHPREESDVLLPEETRRTKGSSVNGPLDLVDTIYPINRSVNPFEHFVKSIDNLDNAWKNFFSCRSTFKGTLDRSSKTLVS